MLLSRLKSLQGGATPLWPIFEEGQHDVDDMVKLAVFSNMV
jgi:hypothetical protein